MIKVAVVLKILFIATVQSARFDSTTRVAQTLNEAFKTLSGDVVGDEKVLFGARKNFLPGECCSDAKAFEHHPNQIDLVMALDESGSVGSNHFNTMKDFIKRFVSHFVVSYSATRVALVTWSTKVTLEFDFNKYINNDGVNNGIDSVVYNGGLTATGDALHLIRTKLFSHSSSSATKVLLIITDGRSNVQTHNPKIEAQLLKKSGVEIFAFGINFINNEELIYLASTPTTDHKFNVEGFTDVSAISHLIQNTGCKNYYAITYDACARRCTCSNGKLTNCQRIRKNFLDMSDKERCRYIRAVRKASTVQPFKSEYDRLIGIHEQYFNSGIHGNGGVILPWHRWYILAYENLLRKVDCRVTVPYWDWSLDSDRPFTSDMWSTNLCTYTGLGGNGNPNCVTTGPFASPGWRLTPSAANNCLRRSFNGGVADCTAVQDLLDTTTAQFNDFHIGLEVVLHNTVHVSIGGTMATRESSNAPEFFFHHGFIDKIWGDWQEKGYSYKIHHYYSKFTAMPGTAYSPRDLHDLNNQPNSVKVYYEEPDRLCSIAGRKFTTQQIAKLSVSARLNLDRTPVPKISRAALTVFPVSQSVINSLPAVTRRLFGVSVPFDAPPIQIKPPLDPFDPKIDLPIRQPRPGSPGIRPQTRGPADLRLQRHANEKDQK